MSPRSRRCCATTDQRRAMSSPRSSARGPMRRSFPCGAVTVRRSRHRHPMACRNSERSQRRLPIGQALRHSPRASSRVCRSLAKVQAMSCVRSHRGVAGKRIRLDVGAGERRRPTQGRQDKANLVRTPFWRKCLSAHRFLGRYCRSLWEIWETTRFSTILFFERFKHLLGRYLPTSVQPPNFGDYGTGRRPLRAPGGALAP